MGFNFIKKGSYLWRGANCYSWSIYPKVEDKIDLIGKSPVEASPNWGNYLENHEGHTEQVPSLVWGYEDSCFS